MTAPVFIGGFMKSGTTLLRAILGRHSAFFAGLETHWFTPEFRADWKNAKSEVGVRLQHFFSIGEQEYEAIMGAARDSRDGLTGLLDFCAHRAGRRRWIEKTPGNILHIKSIVDRWPDATLVHVVRDPRDIYASWKRNNKYDLDRFLSDGKLIESALADRLGTSNSQYCEVRYAELVTDATTAISQALTWLGEEFEQGLEQFDGAPQEFEIVKAATGKESATLKSLARPIFRDSVGSWREVLSSEEAHAILERLPCYASAAGSRP